MNYHNITTQQAVTALPLQVGGTVNPQFETSPEVLLIAGWRIETALPGSIAIGYERLSIRWIQDPADPQGAIPQYTDTLISDRIAQEAAIRAAQVLEAKALAKSLYPGPGDIQHCTPEAVARLLLAECVVLYTWLFTAAASGGHVPTKTAQQVTDAVYAAMDAQT